MPVRPVQVWKQMTPEQRLAAADAFWREADGEGGMHAQHAEAIVMLARRMNFRPRSVQTLPVERRSKLLAGARDLSDAMAARALIAFHLAHRRPMMAAFLDALGIAHDDGVITAEDEPPPDRERLAKGVAALREQFPIDDVNLYLETLSAVDGDTWAGLAAQRPVSS